MNGSPTKGKSEEDLAKEGRRMSSDLDNGKKTSKEVIDPLNQNLDQDEEGEMEEFTNEEEEEEWEEYEGEEEELGEASEEEEEEDQESTEGLVKSGFPLLEVPKVVNETEGKAPPQGKLKRRASDIEGLPRYLIKKLIKEMSKKLEKLKAENLVLERSVASMEARENEIAANIPKFTYRYPWEREKAENGEDVEDEAAEIGAVCEYESSDEDEERNPFNPKTDLNWDDPALAEVFEGSQEALDAFLNSVGEIAPSNFDVIKHTYKDLVEAATKGDGGPNPAVLHDYLPHRHHHHAHHKHHLSITGGHPSPQMKVESASESGGSDSDESEGQIEKLHSAIFNVGDDGVEEPFHDDSQFNILLAKKLPPHVRFICIEGEIPQLVDQFYAEILAKREKGFNQNPSYSIKAYETLFNMTLKQLKELHMVAQKSWLPYLKRFKAESLLLFLKNMKNFFLHEENKYKISNSEFKKSKRGTDIKLKQNQELGDSLQLIDFEELRIQNIELAQDIQDENYNLRNLKTVFANTFKHLSESRAVVFNQRAAEKKILDNVEICNIMKSKMEYTVTKLEQEVIDSKQKSDFYKKRLRAFRAPSTMEYVREKYEEGILEYNLKSVHRKLDAITNEKNVIQRGFNKFKKNFPTTADMRYENHRWLEAIKQEVQERNLLKILESDHSNIHSPSTMSIRPSQQHPKKSRPILINPLESKSKARPTLNKFEMPSAPRISTRKTVVEVDDLALIKSRLPIPTPGTLMALAKQHKEEDDFIASQGIKPVSVISKKISIMPNPSAARQSRPEVATPTPTRRKTIASMKAHHSSAARDKDQLMLRRKSYAE